jgi:ATP-dependent Clp protease protease subunit|nr:MAG TPA: Protease subunit of ATP-dependent Clp protease [Caudoviricetes sp.]
MEINDLMLLIKDVLGVTDKLYDRQIEENLKDRRIIFNQEVDSGVVEDAILHIFKWNQEDKNIPVNERKRIHLYINTNGGDVPSGLSLVGAIRASITPITGVVLSVAASMGSYIITACHERIAFTDSVVLLHDGQSGVYASARKADDTMKYYKKMDDRCRKILLETTSLTEEYLDEIADRETYLFADECKEKGIIDKIIGVDVDLEYIL